MHAPRKLCQLQIQRQLELLDQFNNQRTRTPIGHVGAVQASYVALTTSKGLVVLDPLRGNVLWSKISVAPQTEVFGDDQHLFLVNSSGSGVTDMHARL